MRALERQRDYHRDERKGIAEILSNDSHLRRGVQRLALFEVQTESNFHSRYHHLSRHSDGLYLTDDDARFFIKELTENGNPEAREAWMAQVDQFRVDRKVPKEIQEIALPFADGDEELVSFLTERAKQPEYEKWELKHRKEERARERKKQKQFEVARKNYAAKVTEIKRGEREWLVNPAQAYLGLFNDLNSEAQPADRIAKWLGEELKGVVLIGFEAVLHRTDLPTGDEISKNFAKSIVLNFIYPMLAGAGRRMIEGRGFSDLSSELLSAISVAAENSLIENREGFEGLREALDRQLRTDPVSYERHIRRKYEPMLKAIRPHVSGLYGFVRSDLERPLSTKLSIEWLSNFPEIHLNIQHELAGCLINTPGDGQANARTALAKIARKKVKNNSLSDGDEKLWQGIHFLFDFDSALKTIPKVTVDTQEWLWVLAAHISPRDSREEQSVDTSINQLKWIVEEFRRVWIYSDRPTGVTSGDTNSWDATELLKQLIYQIAKDPSDEATLALTKLRDMQNDGYMVTIKGALAAQHRVRLEANFITPTFAALKAVLSNKRPQSAADIQAIVLDEFNQLQTKFRGDPFDIVNLFYDDAGKPRTENACRDRFLIALNKLPFGISTSPEVAMPKGRRSDAAFVYAQFAVPFEVKGQWHKEVWTAAATQLDRFYSIDYKAGGKGIYLVFWFGVDAPSGKRLKLPPNGATRPSSAKEMQVMLESNLPSHRRDDIATFVLDVTRV